MAHHHYYVDMVEEPLLPQLMYTGIVSNTPGWFNKSHSHDYCEVMYVAAGRGAALIGGKEYALKPGSLVVYNPGVLHEERSLQGQPLLLPFFGATGFSSGSLPVGCLVPLGCSPVIDCGLYSEQISNLFDGLIQESISQKPHHRHIVQGLLTAILALCMRVVEEHAASDNGRDISFAVSTYIEKHCGDPITLDSLAERFYISKYHLAHLFKKQTGVSPIRYLADRRMELACTLLAQTGTSVNEIAAQVGFENPQYFRQSFKKHTGLTPGEYRTQRGDAAVGS